jgi:hypothetical protein
MNNLPEESATTYMLRGLDFIVPGEWQNITKFDNMVVDVTGNGDSEYINRVRSRALEIYASPDHGYQQAMWLYEMVDRTDKALATAAIANKIGEKIGFLSFLSRMTPKADTTQSIDLGLKLGVEIAAFFYINGVRGHSVNSFVDALSNYAGESKMRMVTLVAVDGLVPLGPDFAKQAMDVLGSMDTSQLGKSSTFKQLGSMLPGDTDSDKLSFIRNGLDAASGWMTDLVDRTGLTPQKVTSNLQRFIDFSDDNLDYVGAFIDGATDYYQHTGTQSIARQVILKAANDI